MFVTIDIIISILIAYLKQNKKQALIFSMLVLFILWGCQYEIVRDWPSNFERWNLANDPSAVKQMGVNIDSLFLLILKMAKPLTFFGWLMFSAFLELRIIYKFIIKYVNPKFYWISLFVLMLRVYIGFLIINSNRQSIALVLTMTALYILLECYSSHKFKLKDIIIICVLMIAAPFVHSSAVFAFILIPVVLFMPIVSKWKTKYIVAFFYIVFFSRYFIELETLQATLIQIMGQVEGGTSYISYLQEIQVDEHLVLSLAEQSINVLIITISGIAFKQLSVGGKVFALCYLVSLFMQTFFGGNLARIVLFLYVYLIFLIPILVEYSTKYLNTRYKYLVKCTYLILISFCIISYYNNIYVSTEGNYTNWKNFKTVFEADRWK